MSVAFTHVASSSHNIFKNVYTTVGSRVVAAPDTNFMAQITAPFTEEQIQSMNEYQKSDRVHPFTCSEHSDIPLIATPAGWICKHCDYKQYWSHEWMGDWRWREFEL